MTVEPTWQTYSLFEYVTDNTPDGWEEFFEMEDVQKQLKRISKVLDKEREDLIFYPPLNQVFRALEETPLENINSVIIGQDPYHNPGSAVGLCFSLPPDQPINPSLKNIYRELKSVGYSPVENGDLSHWAEQGVLMYNMALTVEKGRANSHTSLWRTFSNLLMTYVAQNTDAYWMLFGNNAIALEKICLSDTDPDKILKTTHPSPLGAHKSSKHAEAFLGSGIFAKIPGINWDGKDSDYN